MNLKQNEQGRSMVEMLGVLAVIGVLSVAGIAGYTTAMNKHRANELLNEASKRAVISVAQIAAGRTPSISEFTNPLDHNFELKGPDGTSAWKDTDKQFSITISGVGEAVCQQMKNALGGVIKGFKPDTCADNATVILTFNNDLSAGEGANGSEEDNPLAQNLCSEGKIQEYQNDSWVDLSGRTCSPDSRCEAGKTYCLANSTFATGYLCIDGNISGDDYSCFYCGPTRKKCMYDQSAECTRADFAVANDLVIKSCTDGCNAAGTACQEDDPTPVTNPTDPPVTDPIDPPVTDPIDPNATPFVVGTRSVSHYNLVNSGDGCPTGYRWVKQNDLIGFSVSDLSDTTKCSNCNTITIGIWFSDYWTTNGTAMGIFLDTPDTYIHNREKVAPALCILDD